MNSGLVESIEILRKNKRYFVNQNDYTKILLNLYNEISNNIKQCSIEEKIFVENLEKEFNSIQITNIITNKEYNDLLYNIQKKDYFPDILKIKNFTKLSTKYELFDLLYAENNLILLSKKKYDIQIKPILIDYNKLEVIDFIKMILYLCEKANGYKNKVIISIILFDFIFRNFKFVKDNHKFGITVKNKLEEYLNNNGDIDKINYVIKEYNLEKDLINRWKNEFDLEFQHDNQNI